MEWRNIYRGLLMGVSDVVPGVSGGTIAVILGIYDQLIAAINGLFSRDWRKHLSFLIPLAIGMGLGILSFSRLMGFLLKNHAGPTYFLFIGLILGILPYLFRESDAKRSFKWYHIGILIIAIYLMSLITPGVGENAIIVDKTAATYLYLFFSGFIASAAMILPGISGSLVLMIIGTYETVIAAVNDFDIKVIFIVGIGILMGIITMSKIIQFILTKYRTATFAFIIGLVIGSIYVIYTSYIATSGWMNSSGEIITSAVAFFIGLLFAVLLGKIEY